MKLKPAVASGHLCLCQPYQQSPQLGSALTLSSTLLHHCLNMAAIRATVSACLNACVCVCVFSHFLHIMALSTSKMAQYQRVIIELKTLFIGEKICPHGVSVCEYLCALCAFEIVDLCISCSSCCMCPWYKQRRAERHRDICWDVLNFNKICSEEYEAWAIFQFLSTLSWISRGRLYFHHAQLIRSPPVPWASPHLIRPMSHVPIKLLINVCPFFSFLFSLLSNSPPAFKFFH